MIHVEDTYQNIRTILFHMGCTVGRHLVRWPSVYKVVTKVQVICHARRNSVTLKHTLLYE